MSSQTFGPNGSPTLVILTWQFPAKFRIKMGGAWQENEWSIRENWTEYIRFVPNLSEFLTRPANRFENEFFLESLGNCRFHATRRRRRRRFRYFAVADNLLVDSPRQTTRETTSVKRIQTARGMPLRHPVSAALQDEKVTKRLSKNWCCFQERINSDVLLVFNPEFLEGSAPRSVNVHQQHMFAFFSSPATHLRFFWF